MTPCTKFGYKVGDLFKVVNPSVHSDHQPAFGDGSTIRLEYDDGSYFPLFALVEGRCQYKNAEGGKPGAFEFLENVRPISEHPHPIDEHQELRTQLQIAVARLEDMLLGDDAQAWDEAEKALPAMKRALGDEK